MAGTLLLDEIGDNACAAFKQNCCAVFEERAVRRLGSRKEVEVDVRLPGGRTNRNPQDR